MDDIDSYLLILCVKLYNGKYLDKNDLGSINKMGYINP